MRDAACVCQPFYESVDLVLIAIFVLKSTLVMKINERVLPYITTEGIQPSRSTQIHVRWG